MNFFEKMHRINNVKKDYVFIHKTNDKLVEDEKQLVENLVLRIWYHFDAYNQDIQQFDNISCIGGCKNAMDSLLLHLKYYKSDEKAIKEEHNDLLEILNKKQENYNRYLETIKLLQYVKQTRYLANFYKKNKNLHKIEMSRELIHNANIDRHDSKDYIKQAIYSKVLITEPIDYEYLEKAKKQLQEMREKLTQTTYKALPEQKSNDNTMEQ